MIYFSDYLVNNCGSTIVISNDEQIRVNLTAAHNYSNNMNCNVTLQSSPGKLLKIDVAYINTESCCDWVAIYDGYSNNGTLLGEYIR